MVIKGTYMLQPQLTVQIVSVQSTMTFSWYTTQMETLVTRNMQKKANVIHQPKTAPYIIAVFCVVFQVSVNDILSAGAMCVNSISIMP